MILDEIERVCVSEGERVRERRVGVFVKVGGDVCICSKRREGKDEREVCVSLRWRG